MVGTKMDRSPSRYGATASAFASRVMYSSQLEESSRTGLEAVPAVTIVLPPGHPLGHAAQFRDGTRGLQPDSAIGDKYQQFLTRLQLQLLAQLLWDDNLELRRYGYSVHQQVTIRTCYR